MAPNKQWMQLVDRRLDDAYIIGRTGETDEIRCPCVKCCNTTPGTRKMVRDHLIVYGIIQNYTFWYHHGERLGEPQSDSEFEDDDENGISAEELKDANSSEL
ncbi:hypothetical protein KY284_005145 [Solanum tuberosum]|nr:hypothetical protein KY284_005145 [Solanum tuberosum]